VKPTRKQRQEADNLALAAAEAFCDSYRHPEKDQDTMVLDAFVQHSRKGVALIGIDEFLALWHRKLDCAGASHLTKLNRDAGERIVRGED
jgi:hypothetical protein